MLITRETVPYEWMGRAPHAYLRSPLLRVRRRSARATGGGGRNGGHLSRSFNWKEARLEIAVACLTVWREWQASEPLSYNFLKTGPSSSVLKKPQRLRDRMHIKGITFLVFRHSHPKPQSSSPYQSRAPLMAPLPLHASLFLRVSLLVSIFCSTLAARRLAQLVNHTAPAMVYHNGPLLHGQITVTPLFYGTFSPTQRAIVTDFISSLSPPHHRPDSGNTVARWWKITEAYYSIAYAKHLPAPSIFLGAPILEASYSLGKALKDEHIQELASKGPQRRSAITLVFTSEDVTVEGFCMSRCGSHSHLRHARSGAKPLRVAYIWVGNSERQCPGQCAWPFHQPIYGPQTPPLAAPNNEVGMDGMVINLAGLMVSTVTNPFAKGFYQSGGMAEAYAACQGVFGTGAYPGYAGKVLRDGVSGGRYNAVGMGGRKYLLPAIFDPKTATCFTLV